MNSYCNALQLTIYSAILFDLKFDEDTQDSLMAYTNIVQLDYIPEEFLEWFYADVIKLEFSDDNDAENLYKICNLGSESTNFLKFTGSIPFLFGVYIVLVIICIALSVLCWPSRFCLKKRRATLHEEDEEEVSFIQKYTQLFISTYSNFYDSIVFTNFYEILDGGLIDIMIGSVVAISMKEYEEKSELGEKLGYICAWVACFLCFSMNILDIVTIYTFRKIQSELDKIIFINPVAQSLNPKHEHYQVVKEQLERQKARREKKRLRNQRRKQLKEEKRLRNAVEPKDEQTSQNKPAEPVESLQEEQKNAEITIVNQAPLNNLISEEKNSHIDSQIILKTDNKDITLDELVYEVLDEPVTLKNVDEPIAQKKENEPISPKLSVPNIIKSSSSESSSSSSSSSEEQKKQGSKEPEKIDEKQFEGGDWDSQEMGDPSQPYHEQTEIQQTWETGYQRDRRLRQEQIDKENSQPRIMMKRGDWLIKRKLREDARKKKEGNEQEPQILSSAIYQNETSNSLSYDQEIMSKAPNQQLRTNHNQSLQCVSESIEIQNQINTSQINTEMELNQEIVAVTKSSLVEQNPAQKNDPLTLEESKQEDKPASKEYQPLYLDHFVMPQDVERYKVLLKKKQHLLLRAHIVIEDLRYSKTSFWPQILKVIITSRKLLLITVMVRQQIFFNIKPLAQVELLFISSLLTLIYLVKVKPFDNREMNAGEIFNNGILYVMSLQMVLFTKSEDPQEMDGIYLTGEQATNASLAFQIVLLSFTYINLAYLVFDQLSVIPQFFDSKFQALFPLYKRLSQFLKSRIVNLSAKLTPYEMRALALKKESVEKIQQTHRSFRTGKFVHKLLFAKKHSQQREKFKVENPQTPQQNYSFEMNQHEQLNFRSIQKHAQMDIHINNNKNQYKTSQEDRILSLKSIKFQSNLDIVIEDEQEKYDEQGNIMSPTAEEQVIIKNQQATQRAAEERAKRQEMINRAIEQIEKRADEDMERYWTEKEERMQKLREESQKLTAETEEKRRQGYYHYLQNLDKLVWVEQENSQF